MSFYNNINNFSKRIEDEMNSREVQGRGYRTWKFDDLSNGTTHVLVKRGYIVKANIHIKTDLIGEIYDYLFNSDEWYNLHVVSGGLVVINVSFRIIKKYYGCI